MFQSQLNNNRQAGLPSPPPSRGKESAFSKRIAKPNPLLHNPQSTLEKAETRRKLFLKKVKEGAEEKRWQSRGGDEEVMRVLWASEEKERRMRERILADMSKVEEEVELDLDEEMVEEVVRNEREEVDALVEGFGSDEEGEDWDAVFREMLVQESQQQGIQGQQEDHDMMDMS
jgi:hypothetical protein